MTSIEQEKQPAQALYHQIKQDILENKLPIKAALKQEQLSQRYGVSRIPIRDVLQKLKNEGWLVQCGKRGVMIHPLSATEAEDLFMMRMHLEPLILGHALPKLNNQILGHATDILEHVDSKEKLSVQELGELNWQFHACLYRAAERPTIFHIITNLHQLCSRYIGFHSLELDYVNTSQEEHYQLIETIKSKQYDLAKQLLKQHISVAGEILLTYLNENKIKVGSG